MRLKDTLQNDTLFHAYILYGSHSELFTELCEVLEGSLDVSTVGNPDFSHIVQDVFTIDSVRDVIESSSRRPLGEKKV